MQESMMMADVGCIVKVSGSRIATPFGPPRPGSTPMTIPSTSPIAIMPMVYHVGATAKPCRSELRSSTSTFPRSRLERSVAEQRFQRAFGQRHQKLDFEKPEQNRVQSDADQQRLDPAVFIHHAHEARGEHGRSNVGPDPLYRSDIDQR